MKEPKKYTVKERIIHYLKKSKIRSCTLRIGE